MIRRIFKRVLQIVKEEWQWFKIRVEKRRTGYAR